MTENGQTFGGATGGNYARREPNKNQRTRRIQMGAAIAQDKELGNILNDMREIAKSQLSQLKDAARSRLLTSSETATLHRLAQVYNILHSGTQREREAMDLSNMSDEDLLAAEGHAKTLLANR